MKAKNSKSLWQFLLLLLFVVNVSEAQITISGTITDDTDNSPLVGVAIVVQNSPTEGTITDIDGKYTLTVKDENTVLIYSYLGYKTTEIVVGNQRVISFSLASETNLMDEIVVVGYTAKKRGELTGSVSSINSADLQRASSTNLTKSLAGRVSGLIVNDRGGVPGADGANAVQILIRGKTTLGNNSPLIVVDGVPTNSMSFLAPSDIASISVLKDGAAAIYGVRAANGVILVTTNRGKSGKPSINFSTSQTMSGFTRVPDYMNSWDYAVYKNEQNSRYNNPAAFSEADISKFRENNDPVNFPNTDWYDLTMREWAGESRYGLTASGGAESVKYFFSANAFNQNGMFRSGDLGFKQYQLRGNFDIKVNKFVDFGVDLFGLQGFRDQPGSDLGRVYKHLTVNLPTSVGQYPNGLYGVGAENGNNPRLMSSSASGFGDYKNTELRTRFTTKINLGSLLKGLSVNGIATFLERSNDQKTFHNTWETFRYNQNTQAYDPVPGFDFNTGNYLSVNDNFSKFTEQYYNAQLNYTTSKGSHTIGGFVAFEQITNNFRQFEAYKRDLVSASYPELFSGGDLGQTSNGGQSQSARLNFYGSVSYDFKKKYLIDVTIRQDGTSRFAEGKRFGTFPSVSIGYAITQEPFMKSTSTWLDFLKIRASFAQLGNDQVPNFQYLTRYGYGGINDQYGNYYVFGETPVRENAFRKVGVPNPDITWERANIKNFGINFALFGNKLTGDVNYFHQNRNSILVQRAASVPDYSTLILPQENIGKVNNYGYEFELMYNSTTSSGIGYQIGGNFTNAKNKVVYMDEAANVPDYRKREGFPIDSYVVWPSDGLFKSQAEVDATTAKLAGTKPGDVKYIDTNADGKIDANDNVRRFTSSTPQIQYGIIGGLTYKSWELNVLLQGQAKAQIPIIFDGEGSRPQFLFDQRWTPDTPDARYPRAFVASDNFNARLSDVWLHDASFIRLKNVEVAYTIPASLLKNIGIRIYARGANLATFDKIKFLDPEMDQYTTADTFSGGSYAPLRTVTLGADVKF